MQWKVSIISNDIWRVTPHLRLHRCMNSVLNILTIVRIKAIQHPGYIRIPRILDFLGHSINISDIRVIVIVYFSDLLAHHIPEAAENFEKLF